MGFVYSAMRYYAVGGEVGRVRADGFAERLDENTVSVPGVASFKRDHLGKIKPIHRKGIADLVVEIVSPLCRSRDKGEEFFDYERVDHSSSRTSYAN